MEEIKIFEYVASNTDNEFVKSLDMDLLKSAGVETELEVAPKAEEAPQPMSPHIRASLNYLAEGRTVTISKSEDVASIKELASFVGIELNATEDGEVTNLKML